MRLFAAARYRAIERVLEPNIHTPLGTLLLQMQVMERPVSLTPPVACYAVDSGRDDVQLLRWEHEDLEAELLLGTPERRELAGRLQGVRAGIWRMRAGQGLSNVVVACTWDRGTVWASCGPASGEGLEAMEYEDERVSVLIGTEDVEAKHAVQYGPDGLTVSVASIQAGELLQIHFLVAWQAVSDDVAAWLAVDQESERLMQDLLGT